MLKVLFLATLATAAVVNTPAVQFTKDSVYKNERILSCEVITIENKIIEDEDSPDVYTIETSKSLVFEETHMLGYMIYDNPETEYIDGLKFDDEFVTNWVIENYDDSVEHTIKVKTVYTDDVAGMLMAAKDGDWSKVLSNPLILLQLVYYIIAAISVIVGIIIGVKGKGKANKTVAEYGAELGGLFKDKVGNLGLNLESTLVNMVSDMVLPMYTEIQNQNKDLLSALILSQSGDEKAKIALIDLLKNSATKDVNLLSEQIKEKIRQANLSAALLKSNAENTIKEIAKGTFDNNEPEDDGTTI